MAKILMPLPDDVHQALRLAAVVERRHMYQIVAGVLREYLVAQGHLEPEEDKEGGSDGQE